MPTTNEIIREISNQLIDHYREPNQSRKYSRQEESINKNIKIFLERNADTYRYSKNELINLRKSLFILDKNRATEIDAKIHRKIVPLLMADHEKKLFCDQA